MTRRVSLCLMSLLIASCAPEAGESTDAGRNDWINLFNGENLSGWDTYLGPETLDTSGTEAPALGLNNDPDGVFSVVVEDSLPVIRISGTVGGGLSTVPAFENYHLSLEFKWGDEEWWPSKTIRDSGLLYHAVGPHAADWNFWMRSQEFQIQVGDCGDYWGVAGAAFDVPSRKRSDGLYVYDPAGEMHSFSRKSEIGRHCIKNPNGEKPVGEWNILELYVYEGMAVHIVNGVVTMILYNSRQLEADSELPLTKGKIQLQSEGAEIFYRDLRLRTIDSIPESILGKASA